MSTNTESGTAIEAETADQAVELIIEDRDLITDDFLDAPNGVAWIGEGYAEKVEDWITA